MNLTELEKVREIADWISLPHETEAISLYVSLHDGVLVRVEWDRLKRRAVLAFEVSYLCEFHHLPEDSRFLIQFDGVQSARMAANSAVGSEESLSWEEFAETAPSSDEEKLEVMQADLVLSPTGGATLQLQGFAGAHQLWTTLCIRAEWMKIFRSDGAELSLEQFLRMGGEYWDDFGKQQDQ